MSQKTETTETKPRRPAKILKRADIESKNREIKTETGKMNETNFEANLRVQSIGKSGFRFSKSGFRICSRTGNRKTDLSTLRYLFLNFHFYRSIGKSEKGFEKLSSRTAVLHAYAYLAKIRPLFTRIVLQILFRISQSNGKKEIHEIQIWIS